MALMLSAAYSITVQGVNEHTTIEASQNHDANTIICLTDLIFQSLRNRQTKRVLVAAHRGVHLNAPENSIAAINAAIALGVDIVEVDVRLTADGIPVLMHDPDISRTTTGAGPVGTFTWSQLKTFRLRFLNQITEEKVPSLEMALAAAADRLIVNLDIKTDAVEDILAAVSASKALTRVIFYNADLEVLARIREINPDALVMPLARSEAQARFYTDRLDLEAVHLSDAYINRQLSRFLDERGAAGWVNALGRVDALIAHGSRNAADSLISNGADIIQTDQPERLLAILAARKLRPNYLGLNGNIPCGRL